MSETTHITGQPMRITDAVTVTYPVAEDDGQRKERVALKLPAPTYSFTVSRLEPMQPMRDK